LTPCANDELVFDWLPGLIKACQFALGGGPAVSHVVRDALAIAVQIGQPVLLWGGPGEGKSRVVEQVTDQLGRGCEVVVGSVREASDFAGLPVRVGDSVSFAPPRWAQRCVERPDTVVFLDELTTAAPQVQAAMLRVVLEREVGDLQLPEGVSFVAAANPPEVSAGGDDLAPPLANRFCHLEWEATTAGWVTGMLRGWDPPEVPVVPQVWEDRALRWRALLAGFISARPSVLRDIPNDVVAQGRAWPSPRSWDHAHRAAAAAEAAGADQEVRHVLVAGLVGVGPAIEFLRFADTADLPDPETLLEVPSALPTGVRVDLLLAALASVVTAVAGELSEERWMAAWDVLAVACDAGRADLAAVAATNLVELRQPGWPAPQAAAAFAPVLRAAALV
jgi:MoxR-like ATPase